MEVKTKVFSRTSLKDAAEDAREFISQDGLKVVSISHSYSHTYYSVHQHQYNVLLFYTEEEIKKTT